MTYGAFVILKQTEFKKNKNNNNKQTVKWLKTMKNEIDS